MIQRVYKVVLWKPDDPYGLNLRPCIEKGAKFLACREQNGELVLWYLCDEDAPKVERHCYIIGTGHIINMPNNVTYLGTGVLMQGKFVLHAFIQE